MEDKVDKTDLRRIPSVDTILQTREAKDLQASFGHEPTVEAVRGVLESLRRDLLENSGASPNAADFLPDTLAARARARLEARLAPSLRHTINATGIMMHSGLGRAILSGEARSALAEVTRSFCTLALDLDTGRRGQRDSHVASLLRDLTGAEAATVVNNNAAATVLLLNTLAAGREVVVSRGQLVEIGGSFRMPDVMKTSGAALREVGTTNKTHLRDYAEAIGERTGVLLRVHHSNYRIVGFAEEPAIEELVELGRKHGIPVVDDVGSGALVDLKDYGLSGEPLVRASVSAGADAVCFSGDKLIGGPQSGIIVGKTEVIQKVKKNPLARAFRCGKLTMAALEATLKLFLFPEKLRERHPLYAMLSRGLAELEDRAHAVARSVAPAVSPGTTLQVEDAESQVGSGSVPTETLPTKALAVRSGALSPEGMAKKLRLGSPPVFSRIHKDTLLLDFRTIQPEEDSILVEALKKALS